MSAEDSFDPEAAAARARGEDPDPVINHADAEGVEPDDEVGSTKTLRDMLMNTEPSVPLESVESPWDPERGGPTRIMRGIQKLGDFSGLPAVADLLIGALEWSQTLNLDEVRDVEDDVDQEGEPHEQEPIV